MAIAKPAFAAKKIKGLAKISSIQGEVQVEKSGKWQTAKEGGLLQQGDKIKTGAKSSCILKWSQGNVLKLKAFTTITIDKLEKNPAAGAENSSINMSSGKVMGKAKKLKGAESSYEIRTPTAIAGVRGTKLGVGVDADETTSVECLEGIVSVRGTAGGEVVLNKREKTRVRKGEEPQTPSELTTEEEAAFEELEEIAGVTLDISQPVGNLETSSTPVTVKGRTDAGNTVTVNGNAVTADESGAFTASVDLEPGVNHIKIEAANKRGNMTTKTRVIKYRKGDDDDDDDDDDDQRGKGAVHLQIISPEQGSVTRDSIITVTGSAKTQTTIDINGIAVTLAPGQHTFSIDVPLVEGENILTISANRKKKSQTMTRVVYKDTTPPRLVVSQPAASFTVGSGACMPIGDAVQCTISGLTEPDVELSINNERCEVKDDGSFLQVIMLSLTQTTINVSATDRAGNRTTNLLTRAIDTTAVEYLEISVSPSQITANNQDTAIITVNTYNLLREPVSATLSITTTYGGTLSSSSITTSGGTGTATFTAGTGSTMNVVTITATSGGKTASTSLTLAPDIPPTH